MNLADIASRFGGDEFILVLPNADMDSTHKRAVDIQGTISAMRFRLGENQTYQITVFAGIAVYPQKKQYPSSKAR